MSFRGLQKAANRALTTVLVAAGAVDKTIDVEFESLETCFKKLESEIDALFTCSKNLLDATRLLSASSCRISANVDSLYQDGAALASLSLLFSSAIDNVDKQFRADLDADYRLCVLDLLGRFAALFPEYNETIKKRSKKLLDYDGLRGNVKKLADKPANDSSKLPKVFSFNQGRARSKCS